jgi:type IV secretory pathway ATPase VirB11/archaellum biosynthesis ATPase
MVAILDTRIRKRYYGKFFLSAIPESKKALTIEDAKEFFMEKKG